MGAQRLFGRADRNRPRAFDGITVGAGRDRRKRDCPVTELRCELDGPPWARRELLLLPLVAAAPDRSDCMQHVPSWEFAGAGRLDVARSAAEELPALREDRGAARPVDRTVDAAAAEQRRVRGV